MEAQFGVFYQRFPVYPGKVIYLALLVELLQHACYLSVRDEEWGSM